jgi:thiol:disulfide interchange protein DsbD
MKKTFLLSLMIAIAALTHAQLENPVKWNFSVKKIKPNMYEVHLTATLEEEWHIYSQSTPQGGPVPTTINFTRNPLIVLEGTAKEVGKLEEHMEPLFGVEVRQFSNQVDFVQKVALKAPAKTAVSGTVNFMVCNNQECMPPTTVSFSLQLNP